MMSLWRHFQFLKEAKPSASSNFIESSSRVCGLTESLTREENKQRQHYEPNSESNFIQQADSRECMNGKLTESRNVKI